MNQRHFPYWPRHRPKTFPVPVVNVARNLAVSAERFPEHPAIVYYGNEISYARLWREVELLAGYLERQAGVAPGDRVALDMQNSPQFVVAYYAVLRANAVVVPLNPMLVASELGEYLADSGARVVIAGQEVAERFAQHVPELVRVALVATYGEYAGEGTGAYAAPAVVAAPRTLPQRAGFVAWSEALRAGERPGPLASGGDDMALLPYTSGTTGRSKGCVHTHRSMQTTIWSTPMWRTGIGPGNRVLSVMPYFHVTGMTGDMNGSLLCGSTIVMLTRWDPAAALAAIERYECTAFGAISTMVVDLLTHPAYRSEALASLRHIGGGGAPLPAAVGRELTERLGLSYVEGYGMTETIAMTHANPGERTKLQCLGIPTFGVDSRVVDPETLRELGPNETGEIVTSGTQVMREYWRRPEATAEAFIALDGKRFLRTGDLGYVDDEGYFFLVDRLKRMINAAGFKVWPAEVESTLYAHPAIREACVIGASDARKGEVVKAVVVLREGAAATADDIVAWSREKMAAYKVPALVEFAEALPRGATGKIAWRELQEGENARARDAERALSR